MMITSEDQLTVGRELWHIYGHLDRRATLIQVTSEVIQEVVGESTYRYVNILYNKEGQTSHKRHCHLADVGIGANFNVNRLFETEQEALEYWDSAECAHERVKWKQRDLCGWGTRPSYLNALYWL